MDQHANNYNMNWQDKSFSNISNITNIPYYIPTNLKPPLYRTSDPRFKQYITEHKINNDINQKTEDELWIETYLTKIGKIFHSKLETSKSKPENDKRTVKIHVAKSVLHRCIHLLQNLEKLQMYLRENVATISSNEWKQKTIEIGMQKDEFSALISQFDGSSILGQIKRNLNRRKRKRLLQSQKKKNNLKKHKEALEKREVINKNIDKWLENMRDEVEKAKREETLKKDADCILSEVTKKKSEARKQLALLQTLIKLRAVREKTAISYGEKLNAEDSEAFQKNTYKLQKMWEKALETYSIEEQGLKVMLENNVTENHSTITAESKIISEWETVLFGPKTIPCDAYWHLTCAEKDIRTFIALRKSWDTFLSDSEEGSRIPIGWILPDTIVPWLPSYKN